MIPDVDVGCIPIQATLLGFSGASISTTGNSIITGKTILYESASLAVGGTSQIQGPVFFDVKTGTVSGLAASQLFPVDLTTEQELLNYVGAISALSPTQSHQEINGSMTIRGNGKLNIILVTGDITLNSFQNLVLEGTAADVFVINVLGSINVGGHASINLNGVLPKNVAFNALGTGAPISLVAGGVINGTFIGVQRGASVGGSGVLKGSLYAAQTVNISGGGQAWYPVIFCSNR